MPTRLLALLLSLLLVAASCGGDEDDDAGTDAGTSESTDAPADAEADAEGDDAADDGEATDDGAADDGAAADDALVAPEAGSIVIDAVSFTNNTVTITNVGSEAIDFAGWSTCNRPAYAAVSVPAIEPGATVDLDVVDLNLSPEDGEFGLYRSNNFGSSADIVAYVQWGKADNGRAAVAADAGLIAEGDFVDNGGEDFTVS